MNKSHDLYDVIARSDSDEAIFKSLDCFALTGSQ